MKDAHIVLTSIDTAERAQALARALVERRLAACVSIVERAHSIYRWQGAIESATEWLLLIKTQAGLLPQLETAVRELHSYALPELLVLPVASGSAEYLRWMSDCLQPEAPAQGEAQ
jgi:periplasmic divalent cation tolerance protein